MKTENTQQTFVVMLILWGIYSSLVAEIKARSWGSYFSPVSTIFMKGSA